MKNWFQWQPTIEEFATPLRVPSAPSVRLDGFHKGIDNAHIDVTLSPRFKARAADLTQRMLNQDLVLADWGDVGPEPGSADIEAFKTVYQGLVEAAVDQVRERPRSDLIQLLQLALLKYLLQLVPGHLEATRKRLQQGMEIAPPQASGRAVEIHERLVALAKIAPELQYQVVRRVLRVVQRVEATALRKLRKSVLGVSWPVPRQLLFNPVLQLPSLGAEGPFINHYPLVCLDSDGADYLMVANALLFDIFGDFLPEIVHPPQRDGRPDAASEAPRMRVRNRQEQGGMAGFVEIEILLDRLMQPAEYEHGAGSWLDLPENIDLILQTEGAIAAWTRNQPAGADVPWPQKQWPAFQKRLIGQLYKQASRWGLTPRIVASYLTPRLYRQVGGRVSARQIYAYLVGDVSRRSLQRRIDGLPSGREGADVARLLEGGLAQINRMAAAEQRDYVSRFLKDFLAFRRDLKYAYIAHRAMDRIRLLDEEEEITLSRTNHHLYDFPLQGEVEQNAERVVRNHVVLKADLRGSTLITQKLLTKKLNPASYFSLNFFGPITRLLEGFGANKVFVEGDALILSIFEYEGQSMHWSSVAYACGLARKILAVMEAKNAQNRIHGLPPLELGIGIAFRDDAPAFLYDERRKIMISPAINQADRLSSCSAVLKRSAYLEGERPHRVEVYWAETGDGTWQEKGEALVRYNVNGIELDAPAFFKLKSELVLHRVRLSGDGPAAADRYHLGRYSDRKGIIHWLFVRESPVRCWTAQGPGEVEPSGRHFFEVVTDPTLIARLKSKLRARREPLPEEGLR